MKKLCILLLIVILILSLCLLSVGCSNLLNWGAVDNGKNTDSNGDGNDKQGEEDDPAPTPTNPYADIINEILAHIKDLDSMSDYIKAITFLLHHIPIETVVDKADNLLGEEYSNLIKEHFYTGLEMLDWAADILPTLPTITKILNILNGFESPPLDGLLKNIGVTKDGDTYTFTDAKTNIVYTLIIEDENLYSISFDDITLLLEYINESNIKVTKDDILYQISFNEEEKTLHFSGEDITIEEGSNLIYLLESITFNNNFAFQFYNGDTQTLVQLKTEIELLQAVLSLQEGIENILYSIIDIEELPQDFATEGEVFYINQGLLEEWL